MSEPPFDRCAATESSDTGDDDLSVGRAAEDAPGAPPPDHKLNVLLPASSWDAITALLGGYPYSQVAALIDAIKLQTASQLLEIQFLQALWAAPLDAPKH